MKFTFWYKKEIEAPSLVSAIRKEPKIKQEFDSINQEECNDDAPCIGFRVNTDENSK